MSVATDGARERPGTDPAEGVCGSGEALRDDAMEDRPADSDRIRAWRPLLDPGRTRAAGEEDKNDPRM